MVWNLRDDLPIYAQLIDQVRAAVASGELKPGERLPGVREMAMDAKVNPNTMQRALSELEREGILFSQRTNGRFVTEDYEMLNQVRDNLAQEQIEKFLEAMNRLGFDRRAACEKLQSSLEEKS